MSWYKEWRYKRLKRRIEKDKIFLGYIGNRIQNNMRKVRDIENSGEMLVISD